MDKVFLLCTIGHHSLLEYMDIFSFLLYIIGQLFIQSEYPYSLK